MNRDVQTRSVNETRARHYLRWYPSVWRERYGEEFAAHLEAELEERPRSLSRSVNIALHGVGARVRLQPRLRRSFIAAVSVALMATAIMAIAAALSIPPALAIAGNDFSGATVQTSTAQLEAVTFDFSAPPRHAFRIVGVRAIGVPGHALPEIVRLAVASRAVDETFRGAVNETSTWSGWPPVVPVTLPGEAPIRLRNALDSVITLHKNNTLVLGLRTPVADRAYAIEGIVVTYLREGHRYDVVVRRHSTPIVMCTAAATGTVMTPWCAAQGAAANAYEAMRYPQGVYATWTAPQLIVNSLYATVSGDAASNGTLMSLAQLRYFAQSVATTTAPLSITGVTLSARGVFDVHFLNSVTAVRTQVCIHRPTIDRSLHAIAMFAPVACAPGAKPLLGVQYDAVWGFPY